MQQLVNFGKVVNGSLVRAKPYVFIGGVRWFNPKANDYARADDGPWLPIEDRPPVTDEDHYAVATNWAEVDGKCVRQYEIRQRERQMRRWTPLSIKRTLVAVEKWDAVKSLMLAADKYDDFVMAQYVAEDDDAFLSVYEQAVAAYGKEAVDAILDQIPAE